MTKREVDWMIKTGISPQGLSGLFCNGITEDDFKILSISECEEYAKTTIHALAAIQTYFWNGSYD